MKWYECMTPRINTSFTDRWQAKTFEFEPPMQLWLKSQLNIEPLNRQQKATHSGLLASVFVSKEHSTFWSIWHIFVIYLEAVQCFRGIPHMQNQILQESYGSSRWLYWKSHEQKYDLVRPGRPAILTKKPGRPLDSLFLNNQNTLRPLVSGQSAMKRRAHGCRM